MELGQYLKELHDDGEQVEAGRRFTLDPRKAREKMKKFQLSDPHRYVLSIAAAAFMGGATFLRCTNDADDLVLEFDGAILTDAALENLFTGLFAGSSESPEKRRAQSLAIGINSALGMDPASITIESWDGARGARMLLSKAQETVSALSQAPWPDAEIKNRVHVRDRTSWRTVRKFLAKLMGLPPEGAAVRDACMYAPATVTVNGKRCDRPVVFDSAVLASCELRAPGVHLKSAPASGVVLSGEAPFSASLVLPALPSGRPGLRLVWNGILLTTRGILNNYAPLEGVVAHKGLTLNVSQSDVVENDEFKSMVTRLRAETKRMVLELAARYDQLDEPVAAGARRIFLDLIAQRVRASEYSARWRALKNALIDLPLFQCSDGSPTGLRPFLEDHKKHGFVLTTRRLWDVKPWSAETRVLFLDPLYADLLEPVFPTYRNGDEVLEDAMQARRRQQEWLERPVSEPKLRLGTFLAVQPVDGARGEVGLSVDANLPLSLEIYKQSRPLLTTTLAGALPDGVRAVLENDEVMPNSAWDGLVLDPPLAKALGVLSRPLPELYASLVKHHGDNPLVGVHLRNYLRYLAEHPHLPRQFPSAVEAYPLFRDLFGKPVTLGEVMAWDEVWYLPVESGLEPVEMKYRVLSLDAAWVAVLKGVLPRPPRSAVDEYHRARRLHDFLKKPPVEPRLPGQEPRLALSAPGVDGELGLGGGVEWEIYLHVLHHGRLLTQRAVYLGFGPVEVILEDTALTPTPEYTAVEEDDAWTHRVAWLQSQARELAFLIDDDDYRWRQITFESGPRCEGFTTDCDEVRSRLAQLPLVPTVDGRRLSLKEVLALPQVGYLPEPPAVAPHPDETVLLLPPRRVEQIRAILGAYSVVDLSSEFERRARIHALESAPPVDRWELPAGQYMAERELTGEVSGRVGIEPLIGRNSTLALHRKNRLLERVEWDTTVTVQAVVNFDRLELDEAGTAVARDTNFLPVIRAVRAAAGEALLELADRYDPADERQRRFLTGLAVHLANKEFLEEVRDRLASLPLFEDTAGRPVTLSVLRVLRQSVGRLSYLPAGREHPVELLDHPVPLLDTVQHAMLEPLLRPLHNCEEELRRKQVIERNKARPKLEQLTLEEVFPSESWLCRLAIDEEAYRGQLGIPWETSLQPRVVLVVNGLPMGEVLTPEVGVLGVVEGPFTPNRDWSGLDSTEKARDQLRPFQAQLVARVVEELPSPQDRAFERARQVVLSWWNHNPKQGPLERQIEKLKLFPLPGGRYADLATVQTHFLMTDRLLTCEPGEEPTCEELCLVVEPVSWLKGFLGKLTGWNLTCWERAQPAAVPLPSQSPQAVAVRLDLVEALKAELELLRLEPEVASRLARIQLADFDPKLLCQATPSSGLLLNRRHPAVAGLLEQESYSRDRIYLLLSGLFSVLNRAAEEVEDVHERDFHAQLLSTLLGGREVAS